MEDNIIYRDDFLSVYEVSYIETDIKSNTLKNRKTKVFNVFSVCSKSALGQIRWYAQWRHYCFFPTQNYGTIYSDRCLKTISEILTKLNLKHKDEVNGRASSQD
jgi:hypothetical protein